MPKRSMEETHALGGHRKVPSQKCSECRALRAAQWQRPTGIQPPPRINLALEAKRAPQQ